MTPRESGEKEKNGLRTPKGFNLYNICKKQQCNTYSQNFKKLPNEIRKDNKNIPN